MSVSQAHSRLANAVKKSRKDPSAQQQVEQARRELAEAKLAAYIEQVVAAAPRLSPAACTALTLLLRSGGGSR